jgi:hypothetical protein
MKQQTAVEWLVEQITNGDISARQAIQQAKKMEAKEKLKYQLFIGKVIEIIGYDKTLELLKECNNEIQ